MATSDFFDSNKDKIITLEKNQITSNKYGLFGGNVNPTEKFNDKTNPKHLKMLLTQVNMDIDSARANLNETVEKSPSAKMS